MKRFIFDKSILFFIVLAAWVHIGQSQPLPAGTRLKDVNPSIKVGGTIQSSSTEATQLMTSNSSLQTVFKREFNLGQTTAYASWETWTGLKQYDFTKFNQVVNYFYNNNILVAAHLLAGPDVYYPDWFKNTTYTNTELEGMLEDYIKATIQTNGNNTKVKYWNVANEAINWDGHYYPNNTDCKLQQLGWENDKSGLSGAAKVHQQHPVWVRKSLEMARKYTNNKLELRDYGTDFWGVNKSDAFYQLVKHLKNSGVPLDAVGLQGHFTLDNVSNDWNKLKQAIMEYKKLGLEVYVTEIDLADAAKSWSQEKAARQQEQYRQMVQAIVEGGADWICFWGIRDNWNLYWLYDQKPLLFEETLNPKPAYYGVQEGLRPVITSVQQEYEGDIAATSLCPNPFVNTLTLSHRGSFAYYVYDCTGNLLENGNSVDMVNIGLHLNSGAYFVRVEDSDNVQVIKVIKQ